MSNEGIEPDPRDPTYWRERAEQAEAACAELARRLTAQIATTEQAETERALEHDMAVLFQAKYDDARAELTAGHIRIDTLEAIIRGAGEQLGQGDIPLRDGIAQLRTMIRDAQRQQAAVQAELAAGRALATLVRESMPQLAVGEVRAWKAVDAALEQWERFGKEAQPSTTPEQAGEQMQRAMAIVRRVQNWRPGEEEPHA